MISSHLATIRHRYDPFNDFIPGAPMVTWTEMSLAECIEELDDKLRKLQERVIALEEKLAHQYVSDIEKDAKEWKQNG